MFKIHQNIEAKLNPFSFLWFTIESLNDFRTEQNVASRILDLKHNHPSASFSVLLSLTFSKPFFIFNIVFKHLKFSVF